MNNLFTLRKALLAPAMLFLCGIFLQSCTEEMPILKPNDLKVTTSTTSTIMVNVDKSTFTLKNTDPGYAFFASSSIGTGSSSNTQYNISGSNGLQTNTVDFIIDFNLNASKQYILLGSKLDINNKSYSTVYNGLTGIPKALLTITKMDTIANTASGSYAYYLYNSASTSTDSIYVSGTFNIVK